MKLPKFLQIHFVFYRLRHLIMNLRHSLWILRLKPIFFFCLLFSGMHKKSLEAAEKLKEAEEASGDDNKNEGSNPNNQPTKDKEELRSESIAVLRAKAQEHSARLKRDIQDKDRVSSSGTGGPSSGSGAGGGSGGSSSGNAGGGSGSSGSSSSGGTNAGSGECYTDSRQPSGSGSTSSSGPSSRPPTDADEGNDSDVYESRFESPSSSGGSSSSKTDSGSHHHPHHHHHHHHQGHHPHHHHHHHHHSHSHHAHVSPEPPLRSRPLQPQPHHQSQHNFIDLENDEPVNKWPSIWRPLSSPFAGRDTTPPLVRFATDVDNMSLQNTDSSALNLINNTTTSSIAKSIVDDDDDSLDAIVEADEERGLNRECK